MLRNLSSAAVVIGPLRVNIGIMHMDQEHSYAGA